LVLPYNNKSLFFFFLQIITTRVMEEFVAKINDYFDKYFIILMFNSLIRSIFIQPHD